MSSRAGARGATTIGQDAAGRATRTLIVGRTQSGKSTLVQRLVVGYSSLVVIDHKRQFELPRAVVVDGLEAFRQTWPQRARRVIYRPDPAAVRGADVELVIRRVLARGRTALVIDEAMELCTSGWILPAYKAAITQGAALLVPVYSVTQRPIGVHNVLLTEAEHVFVFDLAGEGDRAKLGAFYGAELVERPAVPYAFAFAGDGRVVRCAPLDLAPAMSSAPAPTGGNARGPSDARQPGDGDVPRHRGDPRIQVRPEPVPGSGPDGRSAVGLAAATNPPAAGSDPPRPSRWRIPSLRRIRS